MDIKIGEFVTRKSYKNDTVFKVINIENEIYYLKGQYVRLYADSPKEDLERYENNKKDDFDILPNESLSEDRNEYFFMPAKILHIDAIFFDKWLHQNGSQALINKGI